MTKHSFETARAIFDAAVAAVEPYEAVRAALETGMGQEGGDRDAGGNGSALSTTGRVFVVGCGKAGVPMAGAVVDALGGRISAGAVSVKHGHRGAHPLRGLAVIEAGHPTPDRAGLEGAKRAMEVLGAAGESDVVIAVVSGGGSALWPLPAEGIEPADMVRATSLLLSSGATIDEMNIVRKHISSIHGGWAARAAAPAQVVVLVMSDVVGDRLDVIASGPFFPDDSTFADARAVLAKYELVGEMPISIRRRLAEGEAGRVAETPGTGESCFERVRHVLVASNSRALAGAADAAARRHGYEPVLLTSSLTGDVEQAARWFCERLKEVRGQTPDRPLCFLSGGETTVSLGKSTGKGGRNQEFALHCAVHLAGMSGVTVLSCGTDGSDGPTDAAGAIVDGETVRAGAERGEHVGAYLRNHDSYHYFERLGALVKIGPTLTNVMDVQVGLCDCGLPRPEFVSVPVGCAGRTMMPRRGGLSTAFATRTGRPSQRARAF